MGLTLRKGPNILEEFNSFRNRRKDGPMKCERGIERCIASYGKSTNVKREKYEARAFFGQKKGRGAQLPLSGRKKEEKTQTKW